MQPSVRLVTFAVQAGAEKPDISTVDALRRALLSAASIAYTRTGASCLYFAGVIERLGIADEVNRKARVADGLVGELAALARWPWRCNKRAN